MKRCARQPCSSTPGEQPREGSAVAGVSLKELSNVCVVLVCECCGRGPRREGGRREEEGAERLVSAREGLWFGKRKEPLVAKFMVCSY